MDGLFIQQNFLIAYSVQRLTVLIMGIREKQNRHSPGIIEFKTQQEDMNHPNKFNNK